MPRFHRFTGPVELNWLAICFVASASAATPSTTTLTVTPALSNYGQVVTLTAGVTAGASGKVTFYVGESIVGVAMLSGNQAKLSTAMLPSGNLLLRAYYNGDNSIAGSSSN